MSALLPCPFCGGTDLHPKRNASNWPVVVCHGCGAVGPCTAIQAESAQKLWNHRAEGHTEEREKGFREGIEAAAKEIQENVIVMSTESGNDALKHLSPRRPGNTDGLFYADAIRALSPAPQSRGDDDCRADALTINDLSDIIQLHLQLRDFGHILDGNFVTSTAQMNDFIEQCDKAAEAIIEHIKAASAPTKDNAGDGGEG